MFSPSAQCELTSTLTCICQVLTLTDWHSSCKRSVFSAVFYGNLRVSTTALCDLRPYLHIHLNVHSDLSFHLNPDSHFNFHLVSDIFISDTLLIVYVAWNLNHFQRAHTIRCTCNNSLSVRVCVFVQLQQLQQQQRPWFGPCVFLEKAT